MPRIEAVERVAYGFCCDTCEEIAPVRNAASPPPHGYLIKAGGFVRLTSGGKQRTNGQELWFCSKDCLSNWVLWGISHSTLA